MTSASPAERQVEILALLPALLRFHSRLYTSALERRLGVPIRVFRNAWVSACTRAGCVGMIPHDLRRTAIRNLERAGVPRSVAMKLTGHKTESIYNRYAIVAEQDLREGVAKLAVLHTGGSRTQLPFESRTLTVQSGGR